MSSDLNDAHVFRADSLRQTRHVTRRRASNVREASAAAAGPKTEQPRNTRREVRVHFGYDFGQVQRDHADTQHPKRDDRRHALATEGFDRRTGSGAPVLGTGENRRCDLLLLLLFLFVLLLST